MDKIRMRHDMTIIDGNHRFAAAIALCPDIRNFELEVEIDGEDAIVYFNKKLNRLAIKEKHPTVHLIMNGVVIHGTFDNITEANEWREAMANKARYYEKTVDQFEVRSVLTNIAIGYAKIIKVRVARFDFLTNALYAEKEISWPTDCNEVEIIVHRYPEIPTTMDRVVTIITNKLNIQELYDNYSRIIRERLAAKKLRLVQSYDDTMLIIQKETE